MQCTAFPLKRASGWRGPNDHHQKKKISSTLSLSLLPSPPPLVTFCVDARDTSVESSPTSSDSSFRRVGQRSILLVHNVQHTISPGYLNLAIILRYRDNNRMVERKFFDVGAVTVGATVLSLIVASRLLLRKRFAVHKKGIIVVTGASSGIGWHTAVYFVRKGYVVLAGVRKNADYDAVEQLEMDNLKPVKLDVTDHSSCVNAINVIKKVSLQMDIPFIGLVNNAGISRVAACEYHDLEDIRSVFATNLFGAIEMTQLAMPLLRESKGRVIMISSIFGKYGMVRKLCFPPSTDMFVAKVCTVVGLIPLLNSPLKASQMLYDVKLNLLVSLCL